MPRFPGLLEKRRWQESGRALDAQPCEKQAGKGSVSGWGGRGKKGRGGVGEGKGPGGVRPWAGVAPGMLLIRVQRLAGCLAVCLSVCLSICWMHSWPHARQLLFG